MYRKQIEQIEKDLDKKIVFIVGPRQVGKTWLALEIGKKFQNSLYLNYDHFEHREIIRNQAWRQSTELLIFDELHKMPDWKNYLKGLFDTKPANMKILVTGSARLDLLRQAGDSLAGRFFRHQLLPFSLSELQNESLGNDIERFIERGGFPEPFLANDETEAKRWRTHYIDGLIRFDVQELEKVFDLKTIQLIFELLRRRVGSPVSIASLARDVKVSHATVTRYIQILEALYIIFRITPYSHNIARSILKEPKIYFFDNGLVLGDEDARFENFTAVSLFKHICGKYDYEGEKYGLHYLRTKEGHEVDFCLVHDSGIEEIIEAKFRESNASKNLRYFAKKYDLKATQLVQELKTEKQVAQIEIRQAFNYLRDLFL
jgi:predicted AAA+ superfamily ATPase